MKSGLNCANRGVVQVINRMSASSPPVLRLLRRLVLRCLGLHIFLYAGHIPGVYNTLADARSRFQWDIFRELTPGTEQEGVSCTDWIWELALELPRDGFGSQ